MVEIPRPAASLLPLGAVVEAVTTARWIDTAGVESVESAPRVTACADARGPLTVPEPPLLEWTARPDATGRARVKLTWAPNGRAASLPCVRVRRAAHRCTRPRRSPAATPRTARCWRRSRQRPTRRAAPRPCETTTICSTGSGSRTSRTIRSRRTVARSSYQHELSGSLKALAVYKVVAETDAGAQADFVATPPWVWAVPERSGPPQPLLEVLATNAGPPITVTLRLRLTGRTDAATRFRLRRSAVHSDPRRMPVAREDVIVLTAGEKYCDIVDDGAYVHEPAHRLRAGRLYTWVVEVQSPDLPGSTRPGAWSRPSVGGQHEGAPDMTLLNPDPTTLQLHSPALGPWFDDDDVTLPLPAAGVLDVALTLQNVSWLPPASGLLSFFMATSPRPTGLAGLRGPERHARLQRRQLRRRLPPAAVGRAAARRAPRSDPVGGEPGDGERSHATHRADDRDGAADAAERRRRAGRPAARRLRLRLRRDVRRGAGGVSRTDVGRVDVRQRAAADDRSPAARPALPGLGHGAGAAAVPDEHVGPDVGIRPSRPATRSRRSRGVVEPAGRDDVHQPVGRRCRGAHRAGREWAHVPPRQRARGTTRRADEQVAAHERHRQRRRAAGEQQQRRHRGVHERAEPRRLPAAARRGPARRSLHQPGPGLAERRIGQSGAGLRADRRAVGRARPRRAATDRRGGRG